MDTQESILEIYTISVRSSQILTLQEADTRLVRKIPLASFRLQRRRRLIPTAANTNLSASLTRALTFYKGYMTRLIERIDKISDASSG